MSHSCPNLVSLPFYTIPIFLFQFPELFNLLVSFHFFTIDIACKEMGLWAMQRYTTGNTNNLEFKVLGQCRVIICYYKSHHCRVP